MVAHGPDVLLHEKRAAREFGVGRRRGDRARLEIGVEGDLRVHGDALPARERDDHVGPPRAGVGADARLDDEVDPFEQSRRLDDTAQLRLAPHPAGRIVAESGCEGLRRTAQALLRLGRRSQLLRELAVLEGALCLEIGDLELHRSKRLLHRRQRLQHPALGGVACLRGGDLRVLALDEVAVLLPVGEHLLAEAVGGGAQPGELGLEPRPCGGLIRSNLRELERVAGGRLGVAARGSEPARSRERPRGERADDEAERDPENEAAGVHAASLAAATDIAGEPPGESWQPAATGSPGDALSPRRLPVFSRPARSLRCASR